jgi:MFS family permease
MTTCSTGAEVTPTSTVRRTVREHPLPGPTLAATSAATFVALTNYLAPALTVPRLAPVLHTPPSSQAWLINGTSLGLAALLLVSGRLADDYGRRRVFLLGTLGLAVTAGLTVVTGDTLLLTLARVAQGAASPAGHVHDAHEKPSGNEA